MCRNIKTLFNFEPPVTDDEIRASAIQFVRKLSGFTKPSKANEAAFDLAVDETTAAARKLLAVARHQRPAARSRGRGGPPPPALTRALRQGTQRHPAQWSSSLMDFYVVVLRLLHIVFGALWVGFACFVPFVLMPRTDGRRPAAGPVMGSHPASRTPEDHVGLRRHHDPRRYPAAVAGLRWLQARVHGIAHGHCAEHRCPRCARRLRDRVMRGEARHDDAPGR